MAVLNAELINTGNAPSYEKTKAASFKSLGNLVGNLLVAGEIKVQLDLPVSRYDRLAISDLLATNGLNVSASVTRSGELTLSWIEFAQANESVSFSLDSYLGLAKVSKKYTTFIGPPTGQIEYRTPGLYSFIAPKDVTKVSVVAVGGGGGGYYTWSSPAGSGGGLGWKNEIEVVPGQAYTVVVGNGGQYNGVAGTTSYFISTAVVAGYGGGSAGSGANTSGANANGYGGGWVGDGGGAGGNCPGYQGGGGAGGYSGRGGNYNSEPGYGGGGGSGSYYSSTYGTGAGGGVGLYGEGTSGLGGTQRAGAGYGGGGGSGGQTGANGEPAQVGAYLIKGGDCGGGGGGSGTTYGGGFGGNGGLRIIWGPNRAFPTTGTTDQ
jgi:hypothetical protein